MTSKTKQIIMAAIGAYLVYTGISLVKDTIVGEPKNQILFILVGVFFALFGLATIIWNIRTIVKETKAEIQGTTAGAEENEDGEEAAKKVSSGKGVADVHVGADTKEEKSADKEERKETAAEEKAEDGEKEKKKAEEAYFITTKELAEAGRDNIPEELISSKHLIYSSPATLAYNSPGAQGFGVKRAGLAIPGSVMLLLAPGCCGRNTTILSELGGYSERFFYLMMDETDIVTGRHLKKVPQAVEEIYDCLETKPSVVMICLTCVDALLGTDMERICKRAQKAVGIPVLPCYMYALTREGRKPPMVHVRQSIYSLLEPKKKKSTSVNLLGHFAPLEDDSELYDLLRQLGIKKIREISRCKNYDEYLDMAEANFNLVLDAEARFAAADMQKRLGIPYIELTRLYQLDKIKNQYTLFAAALGSKFDDDAYFEEALAAKEAFKKKYPHAVFAIGEGCNANAFELAFALIRYEFAVAEVFGNLSKEDFVYIEKMAKLSPETKIYSNLEPTMIYYEPGENPVDIVIGKDAVYYHPEAAQLEWSDDIQPFGYRGVKHFFEECERVLDEKNAKSEAKNLKNSTKNIKEEKTLERGTN